MSGTTRGGRPVLRVAPLAALLALSLAAGCPRTGDGPGAAGAGETGPAEHDDHAAAGHPADRDHGERSHAAGGHDAAGHDAAGHDAAGHDDHGGEDGVVELAAVAVERIGLTTTPAARRPLAGRRSTTGVLGFDEERLAHVAPRADGRLARVPAALGADVAAGEVLAVVDSAAVGAAKADFLKARARSEVARRRFERESALAADRIASEEEVLEAEGAAREAAAELAATRQALRLLGLADTAIEELSWEDPGPSLVPLTAPFAGRVVARDATRGEVVSRQDELFTVADLSRVWLWIDLYERDLAHVAVGDPVEVRLDAWPGETFTGELAYLADQVASATRTLRARVELSNPDRRLKPGMFARVTLTDGAAPAPALVVPRAAVQRHDGGSIVFVRTAPGRFERRAVEVGRTSEELAEILAGLEEGEAVVTEGAFLLRSQASADELGGHHH